MKMYYILFNPLSSNGKSIEVMEKLKQKLLKYGNSSEALDIIEVSKNIEGFLENINKDGNFFRWRWNITLFC